MYTGQKSNHDQKQNSITVKTPPHNIYPLPQYIGLRNKTVYQHCTKCLNHVGIPVQYVNVHGVKVSAASMIGKS